MAYLVNGEVRPAYTVIVRVDKSNDSWFDKWMFFSDSQEYNKAVKAAAGNLVVGRPYYEKRDYVEYLKVGMA